MRIKEKAIATLIHFSASLLVILIFIYILRTHWYPEPFFSASGGIQGLKLVFLVDLVLGPLLTFVVFQRSKTFWAKTIDFSFILTLQLSAFVWGVNAVYQQRPVAIVFWDDQFFTVPDQVLLQHYKDHPVYENLHNSTSIPIIYAKKPENMAEYRPMMQRIRERNIAPHHQLELYQEFKLNFDTVKPYSMNIDQQDITTKNQIEEFSRQNNSQSDDNLFFTLKSKYQNIVLAFNKEGDLIGHIKFTHN